MLALFGLTMTGCVTRPKAKVILPPMPQRAEMKEPQSLAEIALYINYLEHLVQQWEEWGERTQNIVEEGPAAP